MQGVVKSPDNQIVIGGYSTALSVVVPVYRVERFVRRCIESILTQTYKSFELILIDDGSPDHSGDICDEYRKRANVKVVHQENGGVSLARNVGISQARGKYILFVDADDYLSDSNDIEKIMEAVEANPDSDLYEFNISDEFATHGNSGNRVTTIREAIKRKGVRGEVWRYIFRKEIIEKNNVTFPVGVRVAEDQAFVYAYMVYCRTIAFIDVNMVVYTHDNDQNSGALNKDKAENTLYLIQSMAHLQGHFHRAVYPWVIGERMAMLYYKMIETYAAIPKEGRRNSELPTYFRQNIRFSLYYIMNNKALIVIASHIGFDFAARIMRVMESARKFVTKLKSH